jgi:hypothetical protein
VSAWNPQVQIWIDSVQYTGYVDYNISITRGQDDVYGSPQPGYANVTLLFMDTPSIPVNLGQQLEVRMMGSAAMQVAFLGFISDMGLSANAYGAAGSVWQLNLTAMGIFSRMLNQTYTVTADTTMATATAAIALFTAVNTTQWDELSTVDTWNDLDPAWTWNSFYADALGYSVTSFLSDPQVKITAGVRDVWTDIQALTIGGRAIFYEPAGVNQVFLLGLGSPKATPLTIPASYVSSNIQASNTISKMRNRVAVTGWDGAQLGYDADDTSVQTYGIHDGTVSTYLTLAADAANVAGQIVSGRADATMAITSIAIELLNDNLADADRQAIWTSQARFGAIYSVTGLPATLGSADLFVTTFNLNISRDSVLAIIGTVPYSEYYSTNTWNEVSPAYTWTSYGTAFPTQKWSDL